MKKLVVLLIFALFILCNTLPCVASSKYSFENNEELLEITDLKEYIAEYTNSFTNSINPVTENDVQLERAIKVFTGINDALTENNVIDYSRATEIFSEANYVYFIPVNVDEETLYYTLAVGKEVTERAEQLLSPTEISQLEEEVGEWVITEINQYPSFIDYKEELLEYIKSNNHILDVFFIGGFTGNKITVLCVTDSNDSFFVNFNESLKDDGIIELNPTTIAYEEAIESLKSIPPLKDGEVGRYLIQKNNVKSNNLTLQWSCVIVGIVIIACVMLVVLVKKKRFLH